MSAERAALTKATHFMRDNTSGDLVRSGRLLPSGAVVYRMESGNIYRLSVAEVAILQRYNYRPRLKAAGDRS